ncbi:M20/M25/M40 family metallo-hydrolase [Flavobacterium sp. 3HN19-14]|uniref:M20/M25/M40 family metallo-hydrolase n=1 Tax=Flavobacterium sp. 3HN19-14 TaxID=3448133 RepID=UPI003EDFDD55
MSTKRPAISSAISKASYPVLKKEFIILGGHYDHIGITGFGDDKINNGANDDASGVTAVLEIAKYFKQSGSNKRSILFVCFSGEEKGLLGSESLAKKLKSKKFNLYAMLNFEMIGVPMKREYTAYLTGFDKSNMAAKVNEYANYNLVGFLPAEKEYQLFSRSDNYSFYNEFHVPSQTICTFDFENFDFYHEPGDEFGRMDTAHMTSFVQVIIPVVEKMANSATKEIKLNQ